MKAQAIKIRKFLILSENEEHTNFFRILLRDKQMDVLTSKNGEEALKIVESKKIQFVIIDRDMQSMAGSVFMQRLKEQKKFFYIPCLLFSTKLTEDSVRLCRELGVLAMRVPATKEDALKEIETICRQEEMLEDIELMLRNVEIAIAEKHLPQATKILKEATKNVAPNARVGTLWGEILFEQGDMVNAEKRLKDSLRLNETHLPALRQLAKVYSATKRHEQAIALLKTISEKSPQNINTLVSLAGAYTESDDTKNAQAILLRIKALDPGNKAAKLELGKIALAEKKYDEAEKFFSELGNADETAATLNGHAIGLVGQDKFGEAIQCYKIAMRILVAKQSNKLIFLQYNLGLAMKRKNNLPMAFNLLAICCVAEPGYAKAYQTLVSTVNQMRAARLPFDEALFLRIQKANEKYMKACA